MLQASCQTSSAAPQKAQNSTAERKSAAPNMGKIRKSTHANIVSFICEWQKPQRPTVAAEEGVWGRVLQRLSLCVGWRGNIYLVHNNGIIVLKRPGCWMWKRWLRIQHRFNYDATHAGGTCWAMSVRFPASVFKCVGADGSSQQLISAEWDSVCVDFIAIDFHTEWVNRPFGAWCRAQVAH